MLSVQDQLSATVFAAMMLFTGMEVPIVLALPGCTLGTGLSDDQRFLLTSLVSVGGLDQL
jgi:hypothetical protein